MLDTNALLMTFIERNASDLYLTVGSQPCMRVENELIRIGLDLLSEKDIRNVMTALITESGINEFDATMEYNTAIDWNHLARFRINLFRQRQYTSMVLRRIRYDIPNFGALGLPQLYGDLIMEKRGLILVVGPTGSGKSTTLASMVQYRNMHGQGHVLTIEDPVEFVHKHENCIINQRDVGIDTFSFSIGLKNALRQMPDVIVIGEIRDRDTMEQAMTFAETGHLCLATLHSKNATQAIERIVNLFPEEKHKQVLLNLASNLKAIMSQRLIMSKENRRCLTMEIMLNQGLIKDLITEGRVREIKEIIERGQADGMQTFEQSLLDLYTRGVISEEVAMAEADSPANLRVAIKSLSGNELNVSPEMKKKLEALYKKEF